MIISYMNSYHHFIIHEFMSCPKWQWHRIGYCWSPVRNLQVTPLWCDLGHCSQTVVVILYEYNTSLHLEGWDMLYNIHFMLCTIFVK